MVLHGVDVVAVETGGAVAGVVAVLQGRQKSVAVQVLADLILLFLHDVVARRVLELRLHLECRENVIVEDRR